MSINDITPNQRIAIDKLLVKIAKVECNEGKDRTRGLEAQKYQITQN